MTKLPPFRSTVRPEWIDYNGHMSEAYYSLVFGHATDALMAETGLGPAYRESTAAPSTRSSPTSASSRTFPKPPT